MGAKGDHLYDLANVNQQGAGQVYLGDPNVISANCAGAGTYNINTYNSIYATDITDGDTPTEAANDAGLNSSECLTRPNAQYTNVNMRGSAASSFYSGLNAKVQFKRTLDRFERDGELHLVARS